MSTLPRTMLNVLTPKFPEKVVPLIIIIVIFVNFFAVTVVMAVPDLLFEV